MVGATYHVSASVRGLFSPMYAASSTLVDDSIGSVGVGSVAGSGIDDVSTSGGTIQTANAVFASDSGSVRATSAIPTRTDVVRFNATYTLSGASDDNIQQSATFTDSTFTVGVRARNRASSRSTLETKTIQKMGKMFLSSPNDSWNILQEMGADYVVVFIAAEKINDNLVLKFAPKIKEGVDKLKKWSESI